jgi:hypothetical protein
LSRVLADYIPKANVRQRLLLLRLANSISVHPISDSVTIAGRRQGNIPVTKKFHWCQALRQAEVENWRSFRLVVAHFEKNPVFMGFFNGLGIDLWSRFDVY